MKHDASCSVVSKGVHHQGVLETLGQEIYAVASKGKNKHQKQCQQENGFVSHRVSGLEGFEECLHDMQEYTAFIAISDIAQGYTELNNTPHTRRVKTVFFAMRHAIDDMTARQECMDIMREIFRQFMSVLIQEKVRVMKEHIYLDPRITFVEMPQFFFSGCACAHFQVATDVYTDLRYNFDEWTEDILYDKIFSPEYSDEFK